MRQNLVIVRGGRNSLHPRWLEGDGPRNWDLLLCPYEEGPPESDFPVPAPIPGQKWLGLSRMLNASDVWRRYEYIWLPDDDLLADAAEISRFFDLCRRFNSTMAQPALTEDSPFSIILTMRNHAFFARTTTYVEIMAPCFRRDVLERVLPSFAEDATGWGWGLSYVWAKAVDYQGIHVFDAAPVRHTRPVGSARSSRDHRIARVRGARMLAAHKLASIKRTLFACDEAGNRLAMSDGQFLTAYIAGYGYLLDRNPRLLLRIARDQLSTREPGSPSPRSGRLRRWWRRLFWMPKARPNQNS